jgi:hypothetical protein
MVFVTNADCHLIEKLETLAKSPFNVFLNLLSIQFYTLVDYALFIECLFLFVSPIFVLCVPINYLSVRNERNE